MYIPLTPPTLHGPFAQERIGLLVDAEWNRRQNNKFKRLLNSARFSNNDACIEGIEYIEDRRLDKKEILRYSTCKYVIDGRHIILKGASGNGKTYIACALGNAACRRMKTVRYVRMPEVLDELNIARVNGEFLRGFILILQRRKNLSVR